MSRKFGIRALLSGFLSFGLTFASIEIFARMRQDVDTTRHSFSNLVKIATLPNLEQCTHKTGRLWFSVTNYGVLGSQRNFFHTDCLTGQAASSAEFPGGTGMEYLFQGALWVGGIVDKDTLTSIGNDGWVNIQEMFPDAGAGGNIIRRSARPSSPFYNPEAISDQDFIAVYYDTLKDPRLVTTPDPEDGGPHRPMGLKIEQRSYSWAANWGQDWVFLDYAITNIGQEPIEKVYVGLFIDPDIGSIRTGSATQFDDYCAFKLGEMLERQAGGIFSLSFDPSLRICRESLNIAFAYDNDGDPETDGQFGSASPTGVVGVRLLRAGQSSLRPDGTLAVGQSFNWWLADSNGTLDWGPQKPPGRSSSFGGRGQPMGDAMRYHYLSNQEIDYDQIFSAIDQNHPFENGWLPPLPLQSSALDIADGADSRFLLSAGPFDLGVGESLPMTFAVLGGEGFHNDPVNFSYNFFSLTNFLDPTRVEAFRSRLSLRTLINNARLAGKVFDNETEVSPVVCRRLESETILDSTRMHGDRIPDFKGPPPPPNPKVEFFAGEGEITVRWFGRETENAIDPITGFRDFEGYSVQMSTDGVNYTTIGYYDKVNWRVHYLNWDVNQNGGTDDNPYISTDDTLDTRWEPARNRPLTYEEIQIYYAVRWDTCLNKPGNISRPIDPKKYNSSYRYWGLRPEDLPFISSVNPWCRPDTSHSVVRVRSCDNCTPNGLWVDTIFYFVPEGPNAGLVQARMYPAVTDANNDSAYWYQFKLTGLFPSQPIWLAVVPFDNGLITFNQTIEPQAASVFSAAQLLYPIAPDSARRAEGLKISVYPNPYRIDHDYSYFEKKLPGSGYLQSGQRINFVNLPAKCTIRIYTLDGDLVQQINHDKDPSATDAGYETWDLLTRNAQKVVAGLYIYTVESIEGRYIGKILIIK